MRSSSLSSAKTEWAGRWGTAEGNSALATWQSKSMLKQVGMPAPEELEFVENLGDVPTKTNQSEGQAFPSWKSMPDKI